MEAMNFLYTHSQRGWLMKSPNHLAAFSQSAIGLRGCEFERVGLALAGHLISKGYHGNVKREQRGNESRAWSNWASLSQQIQLWAVCVWAYLHAPLYVCMIMCVFVCSPTSPGIVIVGHSVCGLDGGEVRLQGEQLTGQVWHTAGRKTEKRASFYFYVTRPLKKSDL